MDVKSSRFQFFLNLFLLIIGEIAILYAYIKDKPSVYFYFYMILLLYIVLSSILQAMGIWYDNKKIKSKSKIFLLVLLSIMWIALIFKAISINMFVQSFVAALFIINIIDYRKYKNSYS